MTLVHTGIVSLVVLTTIVGCESAQDRLFQRAKDNVASRLMDPQSAQFRNLRTYRLGMPSETVCGEVNAKNALGGYAGFRAFAYIADENETMLATSEHDLNAMEKVGVCSEISREEMLRRTRS